MAEIADPHFLHPTKPLEALLSPPVADPRAMAWSGEELLVADREGTVHLVEPSFGARRLFRAAANPTRLAISPMTADGRCVAILDQSGRLHVYELDGRLVWQYNTGLIAGVQLTFGAGGLIIAGDAEDARRVVVFAMDGRVLGRARVPARTVALSQAGLPRLVRSLPTGLRVLPWGEPLGSEDATAHHLFVASGFVFGVASGGVTLWRRPEVGRSPLHNEGDAVTVKLYDVANAAISADGETLALATRQGSVSVTLARPGVARVNPGKVGGHDAPVTGLAFSQRGRWLASLAERVWIWSY